MIIVKRVFLAKLFKIPSFLMSEHDLSMIFEKPKMLDAPFCIGCIPEICNYIKHIIGSLLTKLKENHLFMNVKNWYLFTPLW